MDFVKNYFVSKDDRAFTKEALSWLTIAHLPHRILEEKGELYVFNINKYYIHFFVKQFRLENWYFRPASEYSTRETTAILEEVDRQIAQNTYTYHSFTSEDINTGLFVLPSVHEEIAEKAFGGNSYQDWETRFYLTRGMLSEQYADYLVKYATEEYERLLEMSAQHTDTDISSLKMHLYFDESTFYCGLFEDSDECLTYVGGSKRLIALKKEMTEVVKNRGLEFSLHSNDEIDDYLARLDIELPRQIMDYDLPEQQDIRNFAIVPRVMTNGTLECSAEKVYGIDRQIDSYILINQEHNIHRYIDIFDKMCFCSVIPEGEDEYAQFFANVQAQIDYNKSRHEWKDLSPSQLKIDKMYAHLQGLDANASEFVRPRR